MIVKKIPDERPKTADTPVAVKIAGNTAEVRYCQFPGGVPVQKIDKDHGVDLRTGELIEYKHTASRAESTANVARSLRDLRDIINANLENPGNALWVTLTYRENMKDPARLYEDFRRFWQRFKYYLEKRDHPPVEYITAAEPQARGAWHLHLLAIFSSKAPYIPNSDMARIWGQGFTKTKSLKGVDDPGLYLTAYLGNMELTDAISSGSFQAGRLVESKDKSKAVIKGARLKLYPPGFNLYRCSRGVKRPEVYTTTEGEAREIIGTAPLTYEKTVAVVDGQGQTVNIINYRQYNRARRPEEDSGTPTDTQPGGPEAGATDSGKNEICGLPPPLKTSIENGDIHRKISSAKERQQ